MTINSSAKPVLMNLGTYEFEVNTAAYQALRRNSDYRWPMQNRLTKAPVRQFVGQGDDKITLSGRIYTAFKGGLGQLDQMRETAKQAQPLNMVDGTGKVYGKWVILKITENQSQLIAGGAPRRIDFSIELGSAQEVVDTGDGYTSEDANNNRGGGFITGLIDGWQDLFGGPQ